MFGSRTISKGARVPQESAVSVAPRMAAELLKVNRLLALRNRPANKAGKARLGLTPSRILIFLLGRRRRLVTLSGLADGTALSHPTASEAVKALEAKGLVRKIRSVDDARVVHLRLSAAGRRTAEQAAAGMTQLRSVIERLPPAEQQLVLRVLAGISESMNDRRNE